MSGFDRDSYTLEVCSLRKMNTEQAIFLCEQLSAIDPWKTLQISSGALAQHFTRGEADLRPFGVFANHEAVGIVCIKPRWLVGPYLDFLGLLPIAQGQGLGGELLGWMETEARKSSARNLFLCVSGFNHKAQQFYSRHSFEFVANLDELIIDNHDEILMRKRLHY